MRLLKQNIYKVLAPIFKLTWSMDRDYNLADTLNSHLQESIFS